MFVLVLAAEADDTRRAITFLIVCLVGIAFLLAVLTVWYWYHTSPSRRAAALAAAGVGQPPAPTAADLISVAAPSPAASPPTITMEPAGAPGPPALAAQGVASAPDPGPSTGPAAQPEPSASPRSAEPSPDDPGSPARIEVPERSRPRRIVPSRRPDGPDRSALHPPDPPDEALAPTEPALVPMAADRGGDGRRVHRVAVEVPGAVSRGAPADSARAAAVDHRRRRRSHRVPVEEVLSDEDWAAAMRSAFEKLHQ